jgi:hypothetical protein
VSGHTTPVVGATGDLATGMWSLEPGDDCE